MFKYTKRLISDIRFWCREIKLRREEETELDRISDITFQEGFGGHETMAGFVYYQKIKHDRAERKRLHKEQPDLTVKRYKSGVIYTGTRSVSPSLRKSLVYSK